MGQGVSDQNWNFALSRGRDLSGTARMQSHRSHNLTLSPEVNSVALSHKTWSRPTKASLMNDTCNIVCSGKQRSACLHVSGMCSGRIVCNSVLTANSSTVPHSLWYIAPGHFVLNRNLSKHESLETVRSLRLKLSHPAVCLLSSPLFPFFILQ